MLVDLTTVVQSDSPVMAWAKSQDNVHIAMGHVGTHLDIYEKRAIPLEYFKSRAVVIDISARAAAGQSATLEEVEHAAIEAGDFVIFRTNWIDKYSYGTKEYFDNHPQLSHELIEYLCSKHIRFIGIDFAGIRRHDEHETADRLCEQHGTHVIENLCNLGKLPELPFTVYTMWLDDPIMTGLRCRVIAERP